MKKCLQIIISVILCFVIAILPVNAPRVTAGIPSEIVGIQNETGGATFDNTVGIGSGQLGDKAISIAEEGLNSSAGSRWYTNLGRAGKLIKWGGFTIGAIDTVRDTVNIYAETSKHTTLIGRWTDKGLLIIGAGMGWAAAIGTVVTIGATAPVTGTAAVVTGTGFAIVAAGVAVTRAVTNTETVRNIEDLLAGKKKLVFAPFERPDIKEARDIIKEELGFDPYDHSDNEIPDPSTGIPVYKPNIYLYGSNDMKATVSLYPPGYITKSEPLYNEQTGWKASIVDGSLNGINDFLFYEANVPDEGFQKEKGWIIKAGKHEEELEEILDSYAFNAAEKRDFLEFWEEMLDSGTDYAVYPQGNEIVDGIMPMIIDPQPQNVFRVWFYFVPVAEGSSSIEPAEVERIQRSGFTAVEWGGMIGGLFFP